MSILQTPLEVANICPEGPLKDLFQNVHFAENVNFADTPWSSQNGAEGPVKYLFQNVNFAEKCQFCRPPLEKPKRGRRHCKGFFKMSILQKNENFAIME